MLASRPSAAAVLALSLLTVACTAQGPLVATSSPSPAASTPAAYTPSPSPAAASPTADVLCRLPVLIDGAAAFLDIPKSPIGPGTIGKEQASADNVNLPDGEPGIDLSYDWPASRWLPVPRRFVAPDGSQYAYVDSQSRVHLVTVSSGQDTVVASGATWGIYSFTADGIYVGQRDATRQPSLAGLWLIPATGAPQKLSDAGTWNFVDANAAWSVTPSVPAPTSSAAIENVVGTTLVRYDLKTNQQQTWFTSSEGLVWVASLDSTGRPVLVGENKQDVLLIPSQGASQNLYGGFPRTIMADAHGVWIGDPMFISIFLWQGGSSATRLGQYGGGGTIAIAGTCR